MGPALGTEKKKLKMRTELYIDLKTDRFKTLIILNSLFEDERSYHPVYSFRIFEDV